jgi:hypothetical protein
MGAYRAELSFNLAAGSLDEARLAVIELIEAAESRGFTLADSNITPAE